jgi:cysteine-rich repeat protein
MKKTTLLIGALVLLICGFFAQEHWGRLRGSLLASSAEAPTSIVETVALRLDGSNRGRTVRDMRILLRALFQELLFQPPQAIGFTPNCGTDACPPTGASAHDLNGNGLIDPQDGQLLTRSLQFLLRCGNGIYNAYEQCDDGNTLSGDGCSRTCTTERTSHGVCMGTGMCTPMDGAGPDECTSNADCMPDSSSSWPSSEESSSTSSSSSFPSDTSSSSSETLPAWMRDAERMNIRFESLPASRTAYAGDTGVPLLRFTISAKYMPVALTQLPFTIVGTNALYNIHDLRLMADRTGDGVVDTPVVHFHPFSFAFDEYSPSMRQAKASYDAYIGGLSFNDLSNVVLVEKDKPMVFEVHADISSVLTSSSLGVSVDLLQEQPFSLGAVADYSAPEYRQHSSLSLIPLLNATIDRPCAFFTPSTSSSEGSIASCNITVSTQGANTTLLLRNRP